jgi:hypothetical protein
MNNRDLVKLLRQHAAWMKAKEVPQRVRSLLLPAADLMERAAKEIAKRKSK